MNKKEKNNLKCRLKNIKNKLLLDGSGNIFAVTEYEFYKKKKWFSKKQKYHLKKVIGINQNSKFNNKILIWDKKTAYSQDSFDYNFIENIEKCRKMFNKVKKGLYSFGYEIDKLKI